MRGMWVGQAVVGALPLRLRPSTWLGPALTTLFAAATALPCLPCSCPACLQDYPEHRLQFFSLLRAITNHCSTTLFAMSPVGGWAGVQLQPREVQPSAPACQPACPTFVPHAAC